MNCRNDKSCTFLDLFLFILNGIDNPTILQHFVKENISVEVLHNITPNILLTIEQQTQNRLKLSFTQRQTNWGISCELSFALEYYYDESVGVNKITFIKDNKKFEKNIYDCDSLECLKETFHHFLDLYNLCKKLGRNIRYNSKRFNIEKNYCLAESEKIIEEIERLSKKYLPERKYLRNIYLKLYEHKNGIYVPQKKVRKQLTTPETPTRRPMHTPSRFRARGW